MGQAHYDNGEQIVQIETERQNPRQQLGQSTCFGVKMRWILGVAAGLFILVIGIIIGIVVWPIATKEVLLPQLIGSKNYKEGERGNITCICSNPEAILTLKRGDKELASGVSPLPFTGEVPFSFNDLEIICYASLGHSEGQSDPMLIEVEFPPRFPGSCGAEEGVCKLHMDENGTIHVLLLAHPRPLILRWECNNGEMNNSIFWGSKKLIKDGNCLVATLSVKMDAVPRDYVLGKNFSIVTLYGDVEKEFKFVIVDTDPQQQAG